MDPNPIPDDMNDPTNMDSSPEADSDSNQEVNSDSSQKVYSDTSQEADSDSSQEACLDSYVFFDKRHILELVSGLKSFCSYLEIFDSKETSEPGPNLNLFEGFDGPPGPLDGFTCVVTGASQPGTEAIVCELASQGPFNIILCEKDDSLLTGLVKKMRRKYPKVMFMQTSRDVGCRGGMFDFVEMMDRLDIWVHMIPTFFVPLANASGERLKLETVKAQGQQLIGKPIEIIRTAATFMARTSADPSISGKSIMFNMRRKWKKGGGIFFVAPYDSPDCSKMSYHSIFPSLERIVQLCADACQKINVRINIVAYSKERNIFPDALPTSLTVRFLASSQSPDMTGQVHFVNEDIPMDE